MKLAQLLNIFGKDDSVSCAQYAKDNNLIEEPSWKWFRRLAKNEKKFKRMVNQARLKSIRRSTVYKYGFEVARTHAHAMQLDAASGNTKWKDAINTELAQIIEYGTFDDKGKGAKVPTDYKLIRCHSVFDVKHDGWLKARYAAGGHLTDPPPDSVYSGLVSLCSLRLMIFLAELNGLHLYTVDVDNAYLGAKTREKVCVYGGPEFWDLGLE